MAAHGQLPLGEQAILRIENGSEVIYHQGC